VTPAPWPSTVSCAFLCIQNLEAGRTARSHSHVCHGIFCGWDCLLVDGKLSALYPWTIYVGTNCWLGIELLCIRDVSGSNSSPVIDCCNRFSSMLGWSLVTTAWHVLRLRMEETPSRYGGWLQIYWISSCRQPTRGGPPAWGLGVMLTTPHYKK
jgi:hypothetical protein